MQNPNQQPNPNPENKPKPAVPTDPAAPGTKVSNSEVKNFLVDYWEATKIVMSSPVQFFKMMPTEGGLQAPSKFLAVSVAGYFVTQFIWCHDIFITFFDTAFCVLFLVVMARGILYLLKQFGGKGDFEGTYRVICYSSPPLALMGIQWIAPFALLYMAVLWFLGLKEVHDIRVS